MSVSTPVGCAIVGFGTMGRCHAEVLLGSPLANLAAICDLDLNAATQGPLGVPFFADIEQTLDLPGIEAVFVCTPQQAHLPVVKEALARGMYVFCEKPIAASLSDADAMIAAARLEPGKLAIGHTLRFDADYDVIRKAVRAGKLGEIVSLSARRCVPDFEGRVLAGRTTLPVEVGVHDLDVLIGLAGEIDRVYAEASSTNVLGPGLIDSVVGTVKFRSGAIATVEFNWSTSSASHVPTDYRLAVFGTDGSAFAEFNHPAATLYTASGVEMPQTGWLYALHGTYAGALATEDEHFLATVRGERSWPVTLEEARDALVAALALDLSASTGRPIKLSAILVNGDLDPDSSTGEKP